MQDLNVYIARQTLLVLAVMAAFTAGCEREEATSARRDTPRESAPRTGTDTDAASPSAVRGAHRNQDPHAGLTADRLVQVALQHLREGRTQEALAELDKAVARYPDDAGPLAVRASILLANESHAAAIADLTRVIELQPEVAAHRVNRAQAYLQFERQPEALADLDAAIAMAPGMLAAHFNRGVLRVQAGDQQGALADFDLCIASEPHAAAPYFNRATVYRSMGRDDDARADLGRFLELTDKREWRQAAHDLLQYWDEQDGRIPDRGPDS